MRRKESRLIMSASALRVIVADDERPARQFLVNLIAECPGVVVVGEAASGEEALEAIHSRGPDLALLDLQMPELTGLEVVHRVPPDRLPLVAFVTAFDRFAVEAFELNAIDYLLKPAGRSRLQATLDRARQRLGQHEPAEFRASALAGAAAAYALARRERYLERLPVRRRSDVILLPVRQIAAVVADGELLHVTTITQERYTITYRLHRLEERLDPRRFIRLARGTLANLEAIVRLGPMPGGTFLASLVNGQTLPVSRLQSRRLRETLLRL
jgi:two-component system, LytTR family, response regulator